LISRNQKCVGFTVKKNNNKTNVVDVLHAIVVAHWSRALGQLALTGL
jgi:hypothetical protein